MTSDELIQYYDYLIRLANSKCNAQNDAEDLVCDTMLAAIAYIHYGGTILHPKTWLSNTLHHKYNDSLRKKYRTPVMVCFDECLDIADDQGEELFTSEEASIVRKEVNHLSLITREVLIRFYFGNQSIAAIAEELCLPEGTVKSRLSAGRYQMKKGLDTMETRENYLPGKLNLSFGGSEGLKGEPISIVEGDLIAQNLLIRAYEKPISISDLSKAIGIPAAYIEPIVEKLVDSELMVEMDSGKVYTDFIISKAQDILKNFKLQRNFAHKHFYAVWDIVSKMSDKISKLSFVQNMGTEERTKLDRYAVLKVLQDFQHFGTGKIAAPNFPKRKDGGWWFAQAIAFDAGYNTKDYLAASDYCIQGGHRTSEAVSIGRTKRIRLYEFDTTLWDSPHRYGERYELYFKHIIPLLWSIYDGCSLESLDIPNEFIAYIPTLKQLGIIGHTMDTLCVKIPVLNKTNYDVLCALIRNATEEIQAVIGEAFTDFITSLKTPIPKHLTSVPELFKYMEATAYFAMSIVREAYDKGLHLQNVDYCCPPVVLVYEV